MDAARKSWIESHPYLEGIATFQALVEGAASRVPGTSRRPSWDAYRPEYEAGVPVLRSEGAALDLSDEAGDALRVMTDRLATAELPETIASGVKELASRLQRAPADAAQLGAWLTRGQATDAPPASPGLVRYLGWIALARVLAPVVKELEAWRDEEQWRRGYCPTCGALPTTGFLLEAGAGHARMLACGQCATRWKHRRVACPFCDNEDANKLGLLEIDREPTLRLDVCEACKGYVKTYTGAREEPLLLADWPTLHLDVLARDRGYKRLGASIYELEG
jgi:FdhE protein